MKSTDKRSLYRLERFDTQKLLSLQNEISAYAQAINGLPRNHMEVFEKRGWMLPFLFTYDDLLWGRWDYWTKILQKGTIDGSGPIPQIHWSDSHSQGAVATRKMLLNCMNHHEATIDSFANWLLWGLAASEEKLKMSEQLNEHYYRQFDLFLVLDNPTDYMSNLLCDQTGKGYKSGLGYFPTPFNITRMMVEMVHVSDDPEVMKIQTVCDPCIGCGAMLLPASNYYLRGYGMDISGIAVNLCKIQMYFYAPWYAYPGSVKGFDDTNSIKLVFDEEEKGQLAFSFN